MKLLVDYFSKKKVLFKSLNQIEKKLLKTRSKLEIFYGTDMKCNYHSIYKIEQKSRFLIKNAEKLMVLDQALQQIVEHNFKYKHLIMQGTICSKSSTFLKDMGWQIHNDFM